MVCQINHSVTMKRNSAHPAARTLLILLVSIILTSSPDLADGLRLNPYGGYEDVTISVTSDVPPIACQQLLQNLQVRTLSSSRRHFTSSRASFPLLLSRIFGARPSPRVSALLTSLRRKFVSSVGFWENPQTQNEMWKHKLFFSRKVEYDFGKRKYCALHHKVLSPFPYPPAPASAALPPRLAF